MIVRSSAGGDLDKLFETIRISGFLGDQNPHDREGPPLQSDGNSVDPTQNHLGFWLPHGLDADDEEKFVTQLRQCKQRFNRIEEAFRETEGIPREKLWLESEQEEIFARHPVKRPEC
ncbi:hypothetical protein VTN77DRAFT_4179 [Rasamsonia byssochlamydoides]|uniref:uncharacterized protein n=1 Tax=Rasamsonia byssochlamydoides TaxID=89139 RepID=UPI003742251B